MAPFRKDRQEWLAISFLAIAVGLIVLLSIMIPKLHRDRENQCLSALEVMQTDAPDIVLTGHFINISAEEAANLLPAIRDDYLDAMRDGTSGTYDAGMTLAALYLRLGRKTDALHLLRSLSETFPESRSIQAVIHCLEY